MTHNLSLIDMNRKYLITFFFRYILYVFFLTICSRHTKKNESKSARMYSEQRLAYQTAVIVHIEYNYCHAACMHKVSTFLLYLFVTHSNTRFFFFSFSSSLSVYMCARFFDALFFSSSPSLRVCNRFFFIAHFMHSHFCL